MRKIIIIVVELLIITGCSNKDDVLKGKWVATVDNQNIYQLDDETVGGKEDYYLKCDGKGYYDLTTKTADLANASYVISQINIVTFYDEGGEILGICKLKNDILDCSEKSYYAFKYIRIKE